MKEKTMKRLPLSLVLGLAGLTAACGQKAEAPAAPEANQAAPAADVAPDSAGNMAMAPSAGAPLMARGQGTVTAIDKAAGTITLAHGPLPEVQWPAMTMAFKAAPAITDTARVGDKVDFELKLVGSTGEVTALIKRP
jgi:Cu/Ag efflux protein CusF